MTTETGPSFASRWRFPRRTGGGGPPRDPGTGGGGRTGGSDPSVVVGLVVAILLLLQPSRPGGETLLAVAAVAIVLGIALRWRVAPLAIAVLLVVGVAVRAAITIHTGSDVLDVVIAGLQRALSGENPYGVGYDVSRPPGAPFPYGPLAILWYAPVQVDPWQLELVMACAVLTLLAIRGRLLGLAIYAVGPTLVATTVDGSNDTSSGVLILLAFIVARRRPVLGAVLLAGAVAFKPYAAAWAPAFLVWGGVPVLAAFAVATVALWSPVLFDWGVPSFLRSLDLANLAHRAPYWSLGDLLQTAFKQVPSEQLLDQLRLVFGAVSAVATLRFARSLDGVILAGTIVYLVTLFAGFWGTYAYFGAIAPVLCWRIDDWLGLETHPLVPLPDEA